MEEIIISKEREQEKTYGTPDSSKIFDEIIAQEQMMARELLASASKFIGQRSMTFQVNDLVLGGQLPVWVKITESKGGLVFNIWETGGSGDLRAFYANISKELIGTLKTTALSDGLTTTAQGSDSVTSVGSKDTTMDGTQTKFDFGAEIGTQGAGKDFYTSFSFRLDSGLRPMSLKDISSQAMGVRVTSVSGVDGGNSSKLVETTVEKVFDASNAVISIADATVQKGFTGDLLTDAKAALAGASTLRIDSWQLGGESDRTYKAGETALFDKATETYITVRADGTYSLIGRNAGAMSAGEIIGNNLRYTAVATEVKDATSFVTDSAIATIFMKGTNGALTADAITGKTAEGRAFSLDMNKFIHDEDRYDTHTFALGDMKFRLLDRDGNELDANLIDTSGLDSRSMQKPASSP
jgi:hypothetical protein